MNNLVCEEVCAQFGLRGGLCTVWIVSLLQSWVCEVCAQLGL